MTVSICLFNSVHVYQFYVLSSVREGGDLYTVGKSCD